MRSGDGRRELGDGSRGAEAFKIRTAGTPSLDSNMLALDLKASIRPRVGVYVDRDNGELMVNETYPDLDLSLDQLEQIDTTDNRIAAVKYGKFLGLVDPYQIEIQPHNQGATLLRVRSADQWVQDFVEITTQESGEIDHASSAELLAKSKETYKALGQFASLERKIANLHFADDVQALDDMKAINEKIDTELNDLNRKIEAVQTEGSI